MTSRFEDLNQSIKAQELAHQTTKDNQTRKFLEAREVCLPQLRRAGKVFEDFFIEVLAPRGYKPILRIKERLSPNEQRYLNDRTILHASVVNVLSPTSEQPYPNDGDPFYSWTSPKIGEHDYDTWHPNVGLHFAAIITPKQTTLDDVKLSVEMRAWGNIDVDKKTLSLQGLSVYSGDGGWDHQATFISINPDEQHLESQVETGLRLLAPNVIHHKEVFRG